MSQFWYLMENEAISKETLNKTSGKRTWVFFNGTQRRGAPAGLVSIPSWSLDAQSHRELDLIGGELGKACTRRTAFRMGNFPSVASLPPKWQQDEAFQHSR